jgi:REP element-mobilizing transposase RayT
MNRGIARRTLFEVREDIRYFLSRLAWSVHDGKLEVHAFSVMTTHFHLLVRSPVGELSDVMRQVQLDYVRLFNRIRRRDGPLVRGRFLSKPVLSLTYRKVLVRYIDRNPVRAGICGDPRSHPFGSAACYARSTGPPWLERSWVEESVRSAMNADRYEPGDYARVFGIGTEADDRFVERRLASLGRSDPLDDLIAATPDRVLSWMRWKARLADGTEPGLCVVDPVSVDVAVREARKRGSAVLLERGRSDGLREIHAGLLRHLCGESLAEIAIRVGRSTSACGAMCHRHDRRVGDDEAYAAHASRLAHAAIQLQHGIPYRVSSSGQPRDPDGLDNTGSSEFAEALGNRKD